MGTPCTHQWFDVMPLNSTFHMQSGNKTRSEAFDDISRHCDGQVRVAVNLFSPQLFATP